MIPVFPSGAARRTLTAGLLCSASFLAACGDDPSRPDPTTPPTIESVAVVDSAGGVFRSLDVRLGHDGNVEVFYAPVSGGQTYRVRSTQASDRHTVLLPRLHAETEYEYAVRSFNGERFSESFERGTFSTGSLPAQLLTLDYTVTGDATFPLLMVPIRNLDGWSGQVAIETDGGAMVWYAQAPGGTLVAAPVPGTHDIAFITNGFPGDAGPNGVMRLAPDGSVVAFLQQSGSAFGQIHHDMAPVDDERVYFIAYDTRTVRDTVVNGEAVWEWNARTGAVTKRWSSWDFIDWDTERDPAAAPSGWLHANSISVGPRGNVILSFRTLSQVISIAPDFQSVEWRMGGPAATVALSEDDRFISQHSASETTDGRILLFDNRGGGPENDRSRTIELQIDGDTAFAVYTHEPDPAISALLRGGAYRLPSGNTLSIFTAFDLHIHETNPAGEIVWSLSGEPILSAQFRTSPRMSIAGEVPVDAMP